MLDVVLEDVVFIILFLLIKHVSILVVLDVVLEASLLRRSLSCLPVSILVVLDVVLEVKCIFVSNISLSLFQSLLCWM